MMCDNSPWDLHFSSRGKVACGGLEEEKRLFGRRIVKLLCVCGEIPADSDNLCMRTCRFMDGFLTASQKISPSYHVE